MVNVRQAAQALQNERLSGKGPTWAMIASSRNQVLTWVQAKTASLFNVEDELRWLEESRRQREWE